MKFLKAITHLLVIIGALNWGLVGAFGFNLVSYLFGEMTEITKFIYIIVGLSAIITIGFSLAHNEEDDEEDCEC